MKPWKAGLVFLAGATAFYSVGALIAPPWASATNATVTYSQNCSTATVTIVSQWDGGTIHGVITGPSPAIGFDVPPLGKTTPTFRIIPNPLTVTVSSTNGHLIGELTHTFTVDPCGVPTTTTPPTTAPGIVPGPTQGATTSTPTAPPPSPTSSPSPSAPPSTVIAGGGPTSIPAPSSGLSPISTSRNITPNVSLPPTGSSTNAIIAAGIALVIIGLILAARRRTT